MVMQAWQGGERTGICRRPAGRFSPQHILQVTLLPIAPAFQKYTFPHWRILAMVSCICVNLEMKP